MLTVSIVIPAWNEEDRIGDCLVNATRQSQAPLEVLVVDNKSTDRTAAIVQDFIDHNPDQHVELLHQDKDQGLIPSRNYGLDRAKGDILGRIDADCMLRPNWVEVVSRTFTEDPDAMGATGPVAYYDMP
ncbi:MAG: glycosyltransferase family 2 protein, partial [Bifidobacteriales bacterium]|nr:glycosyltransferase family 2 protein [Bifidobacteriales bacterium]